VTNDACTNQEHVDGILDLLRHRAPQPLSILAIARELGMDRRTAAKYLALLAANGDVTMERFGQKKLYRPSSRIPFPEIFHRLHRAMVILDSDLRIRMANASFLNLVGAGPGRDLAGTRLADLDHPLLTEPILRRIIDRALRGEVHVPKLYLDEERTGRAFQVEIETIIPPGGAPDIVVGFNDVSELERAQHGLKGSERKMAALFDSLPGGVIVFSADGSVLDANRASLRVLGLRTLAELRDASVFDIACHQDRLPSLIRLGNVTETELACDFDRLRRERGVETERTGIAYFEVVFTPLPSGHGGPPTEFAILFKDITEKRRAVKDLKERLRGISSSLPGVVYQFFARDTGEWGVYYVDERAGELLGLPREPLRDWFQRFIACVVPEDRERMIDSIHDVIRREAPWFFEGRFLCPTGEELFVRGISQPIRLKNETVWNGIFFDVTDQKQVEEDLAATNFLEMRYRSFFEDTCNGVLIYRPVDDEQDYVVTDVNRVAADLLRFERDDLVGRRLFEVFPDVGVPEVREMLRRVHATGRPEVARPVRYRDREDFPWISRYVFRLPSGELASFMIDVSEGMYRTSAEAPGGRDRGFGDSRSSG